MSLVRKPPSEGGICPNCAGDLHPGGEFCPHCSARVSRNVLACGKCGKPLEEDSSYCPHCGNWFRQKGGKAFYEAPILWLALGIVSLLIAAILNTLAIIFVPLGALALVVWAADKWPRRPKSMDQKGTEKSREESEAKDRRKQA
jgi:predicted amidophosphoribosyltransferase